jgi:hypothetical protein
MAQSATVPHLAEAYSLAQFLTSDRAAASDLVIRAYAAATSEGLGRFGVLRAVVRARGWTGESRGDGSADPAAPGLEAQDPVVEGTGRDVPLVGVQAGRAVRDRLLPSVVGTLDVRDRLVVWFAAAGISSPSDLANVLDTTPDQASEWTRVAEHALSRRLLLAAPLHDRLLLIAAENAEPTRDALRRLLDLLLEPAPAALAQHLASTLPTRPADRTRAAGGRGRVRRFVLLLGVIALVAVTGYGIQALRTDIEPAPRRAVDAVRRALDLADGAEPVFRTSSAEQAEIFVRDRIGWNVVAPIIQGSPVTGVGLVQALDGFEVPVFFYGDGPGHRVTVVAYTYAFLDRAEPGLYLDRDIRRQIGEPGRFSLLDLGPRRALVFRNRDDIFVAVTPGDAEALRDAIRFPG